MGHSVYAHDLAESLALVLPHSSKDDSRRILYAIRYTVLAGEVSLAATDSYSLVEDVIAVQEGSESESVILDRGDAERLMKAAKVSGKSGIARVVVEIVDGKARFDLADQQFNFQGVEGQYPAIENLWPQGEPEAVARIGINPAQLARWKGLGEKSMVLTFYGEQKPILVESVVRAGYRSMMMPVRLA